MRMNFSMLYEAGSEINDLTGAADKTVARARDGDTAAFGVIFERHSRFVYKFIYAMLGGDRTAAEELTQETFLAAYKSIRDLRAEAQLRTWLCGIAKNVVYKSFRARRQERLNGGGEVEPADAADWKNPPPDEEFLGKELNRAICSALARLDEDKRLIFILKELQHLSYKEIAEITGSTIPKLKTDLHRAKLALRRALRPYLETRG